MTTELHTEETPAPPPKREVHFPVTKWLIGMNVAMFLAMVFYGHVSWTRPTIDDLQRWGADFGPMTFSGQWWRVLANTFIHIGIFHLVVNMWALFQLGALAENLFGEDIYTSIYLLSGIAGSVVSLAWHPLVTGAGASGAIFGIAGALIVVLKWGNLPVSKAAIAPVLQSLVVFSLFNLGYGAITAGMDNAAHLGGLGAGLIAGSVLIQPAYRGAAGLKARKRAAVAGVLVVMAATLVVAYFNGFYGHLYAGQIAVERNQADRGIAELRQVIVRKPDNAEAHFWLAKAYLQKGDAPAATAQLLRTVELKPKDPEALITLGRLYLRTNKADEAATLFRRVVAVLPNSAEAHFELASALLALRQAKPATAEFQQTLKLNPNHVQAYLNLGVIGLGTKDYDAALSAFLNATRLAPNLPEAWALLAATYKQKGMAKEEAAATEKALALKQQQGGSAPAPKK